MVTKDGARRKENSTPLISRQAKLQMCSANNIPCASGLSTVLKDKELFALIELSRSMNAIADSEELLRVIIQTTAVAMGVEGVSVILLDQSKTPEPDLIFHVATGEKAEMLSNFRLAWGEGYAGEAAKIKQSVVVNDVTQGKGHAERVDNMTGFVTKSLIASPLLMQERLVGVLEVVNKCSGEGFSEEDVEFCEAIAGQIAAAVERARLVEENLRSQRLATIGETIAGAAHCIKNIVNAVRGGAYALNKGLAQENLEKIKSGWNMLERGIDRISELSLDMLSYSKEREPEYSEFELGELLEEVCLMVKESALSRGVEVLVTEKEQIKVTAEASGIQRCVINLVSNAINACADKGSGRVELSCIEVGSSFLEIRVSDNGTGMSPEVKESVFKPFFSTRGSNGTGLGLAVTQKIVLEHGGRIDISSEPDQGSLFRILLPKQRPQLDKN